MSQNAPGTYAKGDDRKVAETPSEAVALKFKGYTLVEDEVVETPDEDPTDSFVEAPDEDPTDSFVEAPASTHFEVEQPHD